MVDELQCGRSARRMPKFHCSPVLHPKWHGLFIPLYILCFISSTFSHGNMFDGKVLNVGEELQKESLPLQNGFLPLPTARAQTIYLIPASFSLQLKRGNSDSETLTSRRLHNTEKLIFNIDNLDAMIDQDEVYVLLTVEPEGVVAIPNVKERETIIFNIVCDELLLGILDKAWWVVLWALISLGLAFRISRFLPSLLLPNQNVSKYS